MPPPPPAPAAPLTPPLPHPQHHQNAKKGNKPAKGYAAIPLRFKSYMGAEKCIASQTVDSHYRKDLVAAATKKWTRLHNFRRCKEGVAKPMKQSMGRD